MHRSSSRARTWPRGGLVIGAPLALLASIVGCGRPHEPVAPVLAPSASVVVPERPPEIVLTEAIAPPEPPADRDGDGIPNSTDACPDLPGVKTADPGTNGCPVGTAVCGCKDPGQDILTFKPNSAVVEGATAAHVARIAAIVLADRAIELVGIEGFANANEQSPRALSDKRARAVRAVLIEAGVAPARLKTRASGPGKPQESSQSCPCNDPGNRVVEVQALLRAGGKRVGHFSNEKPPAAVDER